MKQKHFYSHIVEIDSLVIELDKMDLTESEKKHLMSIVESSVHHAVLDAILSELSEDDKKMFLQHLAANDHDVIWQHLNDRIENIEDKIKKAADELMRELDKDMIELKERDPQGSQ